MKKFLTAIAAVIVLSAPNLGVQTAEAKSKDLCGTVVAATWPVHMRPRAARVCRCESSNDPNADNPYSTAFGLFQILDGTWSDYARRGEKRSNPFDNSAVAVRIQRGQGWGAWEESRHCWS